MDLKEFYFQNIKESEYHYRFLESVKKVNYTYNIFYGEEETQNYQFEIYDVEEAITKFKELCQPDVDFSGENKCWFYLITYYLHMLGYEIKEFPRILARPPVDPTDFTYRDIRNRIIALGGDDNGTVRYATRRTFVADLTFEQKSCNIEVNDSINQKFIEISTRQASFNSMHIDEKIAEIANLIENLLKQDGQLHEVTINSPQDAVKYGIGYLSEDRRRYGCVVQKSVTENTTLATMEEFTNGIFINKAKEKQVAEKYVNELATKTPTTDQLVVNLSGGNQQKVVIAKWLTRDSDILIFDEPTRGIDVGAKNEIYKLMNKLAAEGKSIIMISSEMTEVLRMSDRIIIMCEGKVTGCIDISEATQENIMDKATRNID